jgi:Xaa-Pro aminopeptidase
MVGTEERVRELRDRLKTENLDALLITNSQNQGYLTDFPDPLGFLLIAEREMVFITDFCYLQEVPKSHNSIRVVAFGPLRLRSGASEPRPFLPVAKSRPFGADGLEEQGPSRLETLAGVLREIEVERLGFEAAGITYSDYQEFTKKLSFLKLIPTRGLVEEMRLIKDGQEVDRLKKAAQIGDRAFEDIVDFIKPGLAEYEVANRLEYLIRAGGAQRSAFSIVVGSGHRASLPHAAPTDKVLRAGDVIVLDYGVHFQGYNSDMTRTLFLGRMTERQRNIYSVVLQAQIEALDSVRPGIKCSELDQVAREIIAREGYGKFFGHGLGHGIGRDVHEAPRLAQDNDSSLEAGMLITIEPGIYIPDWGGVRIEDTVLVTPEGCEVLTRAPKELMVL